MPLNDERTDKEYGEIFQRIEHYFDVEQLPCALFCRQSMI